MVVKILILVPEGKAGKALRATDSNRMSQLCLVDLHRPVLPASAELPLFLRPNWKLRHEANLSRFPEIEVPCFVPLDIGELS